MKTPINIPRICVRGYYIFILQTGIMNADVKSEFHAYPSYSRLEL